jgi:dihydrofolate reductase
MGSSTYLAAKDYLKLSTKTLRIVMTHDPEKFAEFEVVGQLEFSKESPTQLVERLHMQGQEKILLVGGSHLNGQFFAEGLIDELQLTVEPWVFGEGLSLISEQKLKVALKLTGIEPLNTKGTLLLRYLVS